MVRNYAKAKSVRSEIETAFAPTPPPGDHNIVRHDSWECSQITEAFRGDEPVPRYLHRDRDSVYDGAAFRRRVAGIGLREVVNAKQAPWQNPFCERVIGSIRRECTDHIIALGEHHLCGLLRQYAEYYNRARCHLSLDGNAPEPRDVEGGRGSVRAIPHLGGLHHRYARAA